MNKMCSLTTILFLKAGNIVFLFQMCTIEFHPCALFDKSMVK